MTAERSAGRRLALIAAVVLLLAVLGTGVATAHNPACHQVAGSDGPHYDGDDRTGSQNAFEKNPNLGGNDNPANTVGESEDRPGNGADGCSKGDSQSPHSDN
jgi:hypothetical protein